jgi:outer membrane protein OmpA-like peptidoglycan-associated protein
MAGPHHEAHEAWRGSDHAKHKEEVVVKTRNTKRLLMAATLGLSLGVASVAAAQQTDFGGETSPDIDIQKFQPIASPYGVFSVDSSQAASAFQISGGLILNFSKEPLVLVPANGDPVPIVEDQLAMDVLLGIGLFDLLELNLDLPVYLVNTANFNDTAIEGATIGDLRTQLKLSLLNPSEDPVGFALQVRANFPTGDADAFTSSGSVSIRPGIIFDVKVDRLLLALNLSANLQESRGFGNLAVSNEFLYGVGAQYEILEDSLLLGGEIYGSSDFENFFDEEETPIEGLLGLKLRTSSGLNFEVGGGGGLVAGYGSPAYRVFGGVRYANYDNDWDDDGILNNVDVCPREAEDVDLFEDEDGCPELDNDKDGILDTSDECPNDPEDKDEFEDADGCPDPDNDKDGVADVNDQCPNEPGDKAFAGCPTPDKDKDGILDDKDKCPNDPEDKDGFEDADGCPDPDNDKDGIPDEKDKCPNQPEDLDKFQDEDGCPDPDNDKDGVADANDKCPDEPETINGVADEDGCPDKGKSLVQVDQKEIKILQQVFFDTSKSTIKKESFNLLNQVALVLKANPQVTRVEVQGHTDDVGDDKSNLKLSDDRANSVRNYLIERGIPADRLTPKGYGESQPKIAVEGLKGAKLKTARSDNRRVQFIILEQSGDSVKSE